MMRVITLQEFDEHRLDDKINDTLADIDKKGGTLVDIKFNSFSGYCDADDDGIRHDYIGFTALILYVDNVINH